MKTPHAFILCAIFITSFIYAWFDTNAECLSKAAKPFDVMKYPIDLASNFWLPLSWIDLASWNGQVFMNDDIQHQFE